MCASTNEALRQRSRSYTLDIAMAGAVILLVGGGSYLTYRAEYLGGASNQPNQGMILFFRLLVPMLLVTFMAFIFYVARLFPWPPTLGHWLVRLAFLLFPPAVLLGKSLAPWAGIRVRGHGPGCSGHLESGLDRGSTRRKQVMTTRPGDVSGPMPAA